jgi:hypothetical protein
MGYRNYLCSIPKTTYKEVKNLTQKELYAKYKMDDYFDSRKLSGFNELFELGKYFEFQNGKKKKFFINKMDFEEDVEFSIVNKKFFLNIIEFYRKKIVKIYKSLKVENEDKKNYYFNQKISEWGNKLGKPYNIDLSTDRIVESWLYEYEIFELVRIYKLFDWKNNLLLFTGH